MRKILTLAAIIASTAVMGLSASPTHAQGTNVAVVDVSLIFKHHVRFKQSQEDMRKEVQDFEGEVRQQQTKLQAMQAKLKTFAPGSPDYKTSEEEMANIASGLQVQMQLKRKDFLEKEAKLYSNTYNEVVGAVANFAKKNNIGIVHRFNSEPIDASSPQSVMQGVNRSIVFQQSLNITDFILDDLNRVPPTNPQQARQPVAPPGRPAAGFQR